MPNTLLNPVIIGFLMNNLCKEQVRSTCNNFFRICHSDTGRENSLRKLIKMTVFAKKKETFSEQTPM